MNGKQQNTKVKETDFDTLKEQHQKKERKTDEKVRFSIFNFLKLLCIYQIARKLDKCLKFQRVSKRQTNLGHCKEISSADLNPGQNCGFFSSIFFLQ